MNIRKIIDDLKNCPCGREHNNLGDITVRIGPGLLCKTGEILVLAGFPRRLLLVADQNTLAASSGITQTLASHGFSWELKIYEDLRVADIRDVEDLAALAEKVESVLSIGSGSLNDICRLAAHKAGKPFAIFATAPSMDGFAANSAPITFNNFKKSITCDAPKVIIGDTDILANAPAILRSAGLADIFAKYVALVDWKIANIAEKEHFCPNIAAMVRDVLEKTANSAKIAEGSPEAVGALMEALVLSGLTMTLEGSTRPVSGAEHIIAHFWEIKKMEQGEISDFHGRKVGVATLLITKMYHDIVSRDVSIKKENVNWDRVYSAYAESFREEIIEMNNPSVMEKVDVANLKARWEEIRRIVKEELPSYEVLYSLMKTAGAATAIHEIGVSKDSAVLAMKYHPFMRRRINLSRLVPLLGIELDYGKYIE